MGYDLFSIHPSGQALEGENAYKIGDEARFGIDIWPVVLKLAQSYGWKPEGTQGPDYDDPNLKMSDDWDGNYLTNDGQIVTDDDAAALADALESALPDIPDHEIPGKWKNQRADQLSPILGKAVRELYGEDVLVPAINRDLSAFELLSGPTKNNVIWFIRLCRRGKFLIW